jgi:hypothetical protein
MESDKCISHLAENEKNCYCFTALPKQLTKKVKNEHPKLLNFKHSTELKKKESEISREKTKMQPVKLLHRHKNGMLC